MITEKTFRVFFVLCLWTAPVLSQGVVAIMNQQLPRSQKEALLILPGFGSKIHGSKYQKRYFKGPDYDLFIPKYISRKSVEASVENLDQFYQKHHLAEYKKVHVLAYIVGSWTINLWIQQHGYQNITTIVYDRSPLQERAPAVLMRDMPVLIKILAGPIMKEFSQMPYPTLAKQHIQTGILVESKATKFIRRHKKTTLKLGPISWDTAQFRQASDDVMYTWLNHDQLYSRFDIIGPDIWHFIKHGHFTTAAQRVPFTEDPFGR